MAKTKTKEQQPQPPKETIVETDYNFEAGDDVHCVIDGHHYHIHEIDMKNDIVYANMIGIHTSHQAKWYARDKFETWRKQK